LGDSLAYKKNITPVVNVTPVDTKNTILQLSEYLYITIYTNAHILNPVLTTAPKIDLNLAEVISPSNKNET